MLKQFSWPNNVWNGNSCVTTDIVCCYACWLCYGVGNVHQRMGVIRVSFLMRYVPTLVSRELRLRSWVTSGHWTWSTFVQVMAWCHQAPSHYLDQCWLSSLLMCCGIHMRAISLKMLKISIIRMCDKITFKLPHISGEDELTHVSLKQHAAKPTDINIKKKIFSENIWILNFRWIISHFISPSFQIVINISHWKWPGYAN